MASRLLGCERELDLGFGELDALSGVEAPLQKNSRMLSLRGSTPGAWAAALLVGIALLGSAMLAWRGAHQNASSRPASIDHVVVYDQEPQDCELWFSIGKDCSSQVEWTCEKNDWSVGYRCCCQGGWGNFTSMTGFLHWSAFPNKCMDLTMPYVGSGRSFGTSALVLNNCWWGNPNKHWHFDPTGKGWIQWATHELKCLVADGGGSLSLQDCYGGDWSQRKFWYGKASDAHKPHPIKLLVDPNKCLEVSGGSQYYAPNDGVVLRMQQCVPGKASQLFNVSTFTAPLYPDVPKLFCVSLMLPTGYEKGLLKWQHATNNKTGVGIFQCNDFAVYSNESIVIQKEEDGIAEVKTTVMNGTLAVKFGGEWNTALNTDVFIRFWDRLLEDPKTWRNDWTVKIDPDAVFFPDRLREMLRNKWWSGIAGAKGPDEESQPIYLNNCHRGMHGPIEVISTGGLRAYQANKTACVEGPPYQHKQEDYFYRECWEYIGVKRQEAYNLLFENGYACDERSDTRDGRHPCFSRQVAFHPYKTVGGYTECHKRGLAVHWVNGMTINEEIPGHSNYHHDR